MRVSLVSITTPAPELQALGILTAEHVITYTARVSSPANQLNVETAPKLLRFLIKSRHWSPFELADFTVEVITSRAIAAQILRHKSMSIQEFSLRYAASPCEFEPQEARVKGDTNRQGSLPATPTVERLWQAQLKEVQQQTVEMYQAALRNNIAPEVARMMLPLGVQTRLYLKNSVRGWIHYLEARTDPHAQHEHRLVALAIKEIFKEQFPDTHAAVFEHE